MIEQYFKAPNCVSDDNRHEIEYNFDENDNTIGKCTFCGERFYIVSKTVMENLGNSAVEREF